MAVLNDSLVIQLASPDYQEDWGTVGDPIYATLDRYRKQAGLFEMSVAADSPVRELLMRDGCAVRVMFRGRVEFMGHVYLRRGGVAEDAPLVVYARDETEVLDHTLAWVMPEPAESAFGYSSGRIEPESELDSAQAYPDPYNPESNHYWWSREKRWSTIKPQRIGQFIGPLLDLNLSRIGYNRATLMAGNVPWGSTASWASGTGATYKVVDDSALEGWAAPNWPVPWTASFSGVPVRFQTLREAIEPFQRWADEHTDGSFVLFAEGDIGIGAFGLKLGYREGPAAFPVPLTVTAGTVVDGDWSLSDHTGSRVILGGPGQDQQRLFQERRDTSRESWGRRIEMFKDATGARLADGTSTEYDRWPRRYFQDPSVGEDQKVAARKYFDQQGERYLNESGPETSISVTLQETGEIYYGGESGYQLGQKVTVDLGWIEFEKRVERVTISLSKTEGLRVLPYVGSEVATNDEAAARAMRAFASHQRRTTSER